jgi:hypothetical protein
LIAAAPVAVLLVWPRTPTEAPTLAMPVIAVVPPSPLVAVRPPVRESAPLAELNFRPEEA